MHALHDFSSGSALLQVRALSDQGFKEVTLLGQNVNSYADASEVAPEQGPGPSRHTAGAFDAYAQVLSTRASDQLILFKT